MRRLLADVVTALCLECTLRGTRLCLAIRPCVNCKRSKAAVAAALPAGIHSCEFLSREFQKHAT
eukprot:15899-Heterococcus_DN1.PRE.1